MQLKKSIALAALSAGLVTAAPAAAQAGQHGDRASGHNGNVPSRVANRVKRAERALDRASDFADDGNSASAESALGAVRKNLAAAEKTANKKIAAGADNGPDAAAAVAKAEDDVIGGATDLFDGADGTLVDAIDQTLNAGIDGRDDMVAAIAALSAGDQQDYADVLDSIKDDVSDEIDSIDDALSDDTLTSDAQADLTAAKAKLAATQTAVEGLLSGLDTTSGTTAADDSDGHGDCPGHGAGSPPAAASQSSEGTEYSGAAPRHAARA